MAGYPSYFNIAYEDGSLDGLYLRPPTGDNTESWTFIRPDQWNALLVDPTRSQRISQVDGADTPASLTPSSSVSSTTSGVEIYPNLATVEEIIRAPMVMDPFHNADIDQPDQVDTSLDWDNGDFKMQLPST